MTLNLFLVQVYRAEPAAVTGAAAACAAACARLAQLLYTPHTRYHTCPARARASSRVALDGRRGRTTRAGSTVL